MTDEKAIYVPVMHGEFPMTELEEFNRTIIDFWRLERWMPEVIAQEIIANCARLFAFKPIRDYIDSTDGWGFTIEEYKGEHQKLRDALDRQCDLYIPIVAKAGGDNDYYDFVPSAITEFILASRQLDCLDLVQRIYDSLWHVDNSYYPPSDDDGMMYTLFEFEGIQLHPDHPKD